jgi:hypothetical protein
LSTGASTGRKIVAYAFGVPMIATAGALIWLPVSLIYESLTETPIDVWGSLAPHGLLAVICLFAAYVSGAAGCLFLGMVRYAAWLDGTRVGERLYLRTRWVDLATAAIDARYDVRRGGVSLLVARSQDSEAEVQLPVGQGGNSLPSEELTALADAITRARLRSGPDDSAFAVADWLRELAASPVTIAGKGVEG